MKIYPDTITLRKGLVFGVVAAIGVIVVVIFYNIYHSSQQKLDTTQEGNKGTAKTNVVADNNKWYATQEVRKAIVPIGANNVLPQASAATKAALVENVGATPQPAVVADEELKKAMSAPIASNQITGDGGATNETRSSPPPPRASEQPQPSGEQNDQNLQGAKKAFLKTSSQADDSYLHETLNNPVSPYELKTGAIIPAILLTGINSDLPGQITAQVRSNVYDTIAGKYVLIPQGAKLTGLYDSQVAYGQKRVLIVWKRVIFPNGQSVNLEGMPGVDMSGYAGFNDQVDNHYFKIFGSVILMSVISAGAQLSQPQQQVNPNTPLSVNQTLAASLGTNIMNTATTITQKNLGIQPTLVIRPGYLFNVGVTKDIVFPGAYQDGTRYAGG